MSGPAKPKVLIVEDDKDLRDLFASRFAVFDLEPLTAANNKQAWESLQTNPDVILVLADFNLAGETCLELLEKVRRKSPHSPTFVVITGDPSRSRRELLIAGADNMVNKPFEARQLLQLVRTAMLNNEERLYTPMNRTPDTQLTLKLSQQQFGLGRGGITMHSPNLPKDLADNVSVEFQLELPQFTLRGQGTVAWLKNSELGLQFVHLDKPSRTQFIEFLKTQNPTAFLPAIAGM